MQWKTLTLLIVSVFFVAPLAAAAGGTGGGSINNRAPTVTSFTSTSSNHNANQAYEFEGVIEDKNRDTDLATGSLSVTFTTSPASAAALPSNRTIGASTGTDFTTTIEPACSSGWAVWNPVPNDGFLSFKFCYTYAVAGEYTFLLTVADNNAATGTASLTRTVVSKITLSAMPVRADGSADTTSTWGNWSADPGATNVSATNYLRVENTGTNVNQQFTVSFDGASFVGGNGETIPIEGKIRFSYWEDTAVGTAPDTPATGSFTTLAADADGAHTFTFTATGNVLYVTYLLTDLPALLMDQDYTQSFTVTAL